MYDFIKGVVEFQYEKVHYSNKIATQERFLSFGFLINVTVNGC